MLQQLNFAAIIQYQREIIITMVLYNVFIDKYMDVVIRNLAQIYGKTNKSVIKKK